MTIMEIFDDDWLLRRLSPNSHFKSDKREVTRGAFRVGSQYEHELSVHVQRLLSDPDDPEEVLGESRRAWGLGRLLVKDVKALGCEVKHDPLSGDQAHALIVGEIDQELAERLLEKLSVIKYPT